jgi:branched-chain amino acid transport system ATP-binding protein
MTALLEVADLSKQFGGLTAVQNVSFTLDGQGIAALIGPNGAGKTTLFNLISGRLPPSSGHIRFAGQDITSLPPHRVAGRGIVRTFQLVQLFQHMTAAENVAVGCHLQSRGGIGAALLRPGWARAQESRIAETARDMLALVGLAHLADRPAGQLTYGHQRLLEIARAVAARPRLLLLDEPAAGLNATETEHLAETLHAITARNIAILLIEHDMELVMRIARHMVVLDFGRKIAEGPPETIARDPAVLEAYLGGLDTDAAEEDAHA